MLETRRAKECQRGIAGAAERAKEGNRVPSESSDTRLGAIPRGFESLSNAKPAAVGSALSMAARILGKYSTYMTGPKEHPRKIKSDFIFLGCFFEVDLSWPCAFD